jgi:hypothetical protein
MSGSIHVKRGETLVLPVSPNHSLSQFQSVRAATEHDLVKHPFYSKVIAHRTNISKVQLVSQRGISAELPSETHHLIVQSIIWKIGPINLYNLEDITVDSGGKLVYFGNYHSVAARNVTVQSGGIIRCYCNDPTISATLSIVCVEFGRSLEFSPRTKTKVDVNLTGENS